MAKFKCKIQLLFLFILCNVSVFGQTEQANKDSITNQKIENLESKINTLENENNTLEDKLNKNKAAGAVLFFIGIFCAYWAQNSGRDPWIWFFCGIFFNFITLIVLLLKNKEDLLINKK